MVSHNMSIGVGPAEGQQLCSLRVAQGSQFSKGHQHGGSVERGQETALTLRFARRIPEVSGTLKGTSKSTLLKDKSLPCEGS